MSVMLWLRFLSSVASRRPSLFWFGKRHSVGMTFFYSFTYLFIYLFIYLLIQVVTKVFGDWEYNIQNNITSF